MEEFEDFPNRIWWDIEKHFVEKMLMECTFSDPLERTYRDNHMVIIIAINHNIYQDVEFGIRVLISFKNKRFSKSAKLENYDSIIEKIYNLVLLEGGDNREILNEWEEIKKPEIRDIKINKLLK
jgi:hypothetical protein